MAGIVLLLGGCEPATVYSGPEGPADRIAKIRTRENVEFLQEPGEFRIVAVDGTPWADGKGTTRGTLSPGARRITFSYRFLRCRTPTAAEAMGVAAGWTAAIVGDVLLNAGAFQGPRCPSDLYGVKGIVPLDAKAGASYAMIADRVGLRVYVHVIDEATKAVVVQTLYYDTKKSDR